jgi:hypothetical protein
MCSSAERNAIGWRTLFRSHPMKTKSILQRLTLAVLMLGASGRQARADSNVYSLNVVGYYNVPLITGWNLLANHFIQTNYNANFVLGYSVPDGSLLYRFNPVTQNYYDAGTYFADLGWYPLSGDTNDPVLNLPPGEGFFIWTPTNWTATFVGEVAQGVLINPLLANYSLKASMVPQAGLLQTDLLFPPFAGDQVWRWVRPGFSPYAYDNLDGGWVPSEPSVAVGEGFFLYRSPDQATTNHWWVRNFTVQFAPSLPPGGNTGPSGLIFSTPARIRSLSLRKGIVALGIQSTAGTTYNVQFSPDRVSWKTVATGQTAGLWQEPSRGGLQGYYQLVINP